MALLLRQESSPLEEGADRATEVELPARARILVVEGRQSLSRSPTVPCYEYARGNFSGLLGFWSGKMG